MVKWFGEYVLPEEGDLIVDPYDGDVEYGINKNTKLVTEICNDMLNSDNSITANWDEWETELLTRFQWGTMIDLGNTFRDQVFNLYGKTERIPEWFVQTHIVDPLMPVWNTKIQKVLQHKYPEFEIDYLIENSDITNKFMYFYYLVTLLEVLMPEFIKQSYSDVLDIAQDTSEEEYIEILETPTSELEEKHISLIWEFAIEKMKQFYDDVNINTMLDNQKWEFIKDYTLEHI